MEFESLGHLEHTKPSPPLREMPRHSVSTPPPGATRPQVQAPTPLKPAVKNAPTGPDVLTRDFAVGGPVEKPESGEEKDDGSASEKPLFKESLFGKKEGDAEEESMGVEHIETTEDLESPTEVK